MAAERPIKKFNIVRFNRFSNNCKDTGFNINKIIGIKAAEIEAPKMMSRGSHFISNFSRINTISKIRAVNVKIIILFIPVNSKFGRLIVNIEDSKVKSRAVPVLFIRCISKVRINMKKNKAKM